MITKEDAVGASYRQNFYFLARDGKVKRVFVTGKCQTWKTRPNDFRLPIKFGLYENSAIYHYNAQYFFKTEEEAKQAELTINS